MIKIFDTHTHLNVDNFAGKEQEEVDFAAELGVVKMNIVGFDKATIQVIKPDDTVYSITDMVYDSGSASLSIPWTKGNMSRSSWMPVSNADVEYRFRVTLYDKAGNRKVLPDQKLIFDFQKLTGH